MFFFPVINILWYSYDAWKSTTISVSNHKTREQCGRRKNHFREVPRSNFHSDKNIDNNNLSEKQTDPLQCFFTATDTLFNDCYFYIIYYLQVSVLNVEWVHFVSMNIELAWNSIVTGKLPKVEAKRLLYHNYIVSLNFR